MFITIIYYPTVFHFSMELTDPLTSLLGAEPFVV